MVDLLFLGQHVARCALEGAREPCLFVGSGHLLADHDQDVHIVVHNISAGRLQDHIHDALDDHFALLEEYLPHHDLTLLDIWEAFLDAHLCGLELLHSLNAARLLEVFSQSFK